jgi:hypothetical protein
LSAEQGDEEASKMSGALSMSMMKKVEEDRVELLRLTR